MKKKNNKKEVQFTDEKQKEKGEYYTPKAISEMMARIIAESDGKVIPFVSTPKRRK